MLSHLQESRALSHVTVAWEDKHHRSKCPLLPSFPQFICWAWCHIAWKIPLVSWVSAVPAVSHPNFLCTPSLLAGGVVWEAEKALTLCKQCSGKTKHPCIINTVFSTSPKHSLILAAVKKVISIPAKTHRNKILEVLVQETQKKNLKRGQKRR